MFMIQAFKIWLVFALMQIYLSAIIQIPPSQIFESEFLQTDSRKNKQQVQQNYEIDGRPKQINNHQINDNSQVSSGIQVSQTQKMTQQQAQLENFQYVLMMEMHEKKLPTVIAQQTIRQSIKNTVVNQTTKNSSGIDNLNKSIIIIPNILNQSKKLNNTLNESNIIKNNTILNNQTTVSTLNKLNSTDTNNISVNKLQYEANQTYTLPKNLQNNSNISNIKLSTTNATQQIKQTQNIVSLAAILNQSNRAKQEISNKSFQSNDTIKNQTKLNIQKKQQLPISLNVSIKNLTNKSIVNRQFTGIGLYHTIPLNFVKGEVYKFSGLIENPSLISYNGNMRYNYVNIVFSQWGGSNQIRCVKEMKSNQLQFQISCKLTASGRFFFSLFAGRYGQSSVKIRNIINSNINTLVPYNSPASLIKSKLISMSVIDNNLIIEWDAKSPLTNLTIYQYTDQNKSLQKRQYILSNNHQIFQVPFEDFQSFKQKQTYVAISHAQSVDGTLLKISTLFTSTPTQIKFNALQHHFSQIASKISNIEPQIPQKLKVGQTFKFNAVFSEDIRNQVYIVLPNLQINKFYFISNKTDRNTIAYKNIKSGTKLSLQIKINRPGSHILQINSVSGQAIYNVPIYVGQGFPLIPDYQDLQSNSFYQRESSRKVLQSYVKKENRLQQISEPLENSTLSQKRQYLLLLLNSLRKKYGVDKVYLDEQLNNIAQNHSADMNKRNFFGHTNPQGQGPGERAKKMNFTSSIGQNIAISNSLTQAHLGLQRSASHLQNSVNKLWSRVGVGIVQSFNNQYIVSFEFSTRDLKKYPLSQQQLKKYQNQLLLLIREKNPNIVKQNINLSEDIKGWMQSPRSTQIFQYLSGKRQYRGPMIYSSFTISYQDGWVQQLKNNDYLAGFSKFKEVGIGLGVQKNDSGMLQSYVIFA